MTTNDAKYKIYLDEKTIILNHNLLFDLLRIFNMDALIGIIGCAGSIQLSTHGNSLQSVKRCGMIIFGKNKNLVSWAPIADQYQQVEAIDGFIFATQYDVRWRDDLFIDKSFGYTAQSIEFKRQGYKVVVARQESPWCHYQADTFSMNADNQRKFLEEYSRDIFPQVLVLIPTFNRPQYFKVALESVLNQTYRNFRIVISDDGTNEETNELIQPYVSRYPFISYFRNNGFNGAQNMYFLRQHQLNDEQAEYIQWLMDDDVIYPTKFEKMIEAYRNNPDVSLVTSSKHYIDGNGNIIVHDPGVIKTDLTKPYAKIPGNEAGRIMFFTDNYIGCLSAILIRKQFLRNNDLCWNEDELESCMVDMSTEFQCLTKGNLIWFNEPLHGQRSHEGSASSQKLSWFLVTSAWAKMIRTAWNTKFFLTTPKELRTAIIVWLRKAVNQLSIAESIGNHGKEIVELDKIIVVMAMALDNEYMLNNISGLPNEMQDNYHLK